MKIFSLFLILFLRPAYGQGHFDEVTQKEVRKEMFLQLKHSNVRSLSFPVCPFAGNEPLSRTKEALKKSESILTDFIYTSNSLEEFMAKVTNERQTLEELTKNFKKDLDSFIKPVKGIDLSGIEPKLHLASYCASSELLIINKNHSTAMGIVTVLSSALDSISYKYMFTLDEAGMTEIFRLRNNLSELKGALERFSSSIQKSFINDTNFISYLKKHRKLSGTTFRSYKKHFKTLKSSSTTQLKDFDKSIKNLTDDEKTEFKNLLKSQKSAYKALGHMHEARRRKILNTLVIMSNLTWGLPNTLVGASMIVVGAIAAPFSPILDMPKFEKSDSGKQIAVNVDNLFMFSSNVSFGLFQLKSNLEGQDEHEGGHAVQSAILGPFYLPVVFADYAIERSIQLNGIETNADHNGKVLPGKLTLEELTSEYYY